MYSATTINKSLKALEELWAEQSKKAPYHGAPILPADQPTYHSVADSKQAFDHFDEKMRKAVYEFGEDDAANHIFFDMDELRWIRNERGVSQADYLYYASRYVKIMGEEEVVDYAPQ